MNSKDSSARGRLNVAIVGAGFMGRAHSNAWRQAPKFFDLPLDVSMAVLCRADSARAQEAAELLGWESSESDWRNLLTRDDVDLIDICVPGALHADIAVAALNAGKHVLCEKPLANTVEQAEAMAEAAQRAAARGVQSMVGFSYRRAPAIALARRMVVEGKIGRIQQIRAGYRQDFIVDPNEPLSWRLEKDKAGSGALGDIGAHLIDLCQYLADDTITEVSGTLETFVKRRPLAAPGSGLGGRQAAEGYGDVTVDDAAWFLGRMSQGTVASFEATRFATGRKNELTIEVSGSAGALRWNLEDYNVLEYYDGSEPAVESGFRRILATEPDTPYYHAWWPTGHVIGWEHGFTHQVVDLVNAIASGESPRPTFAEGLSVQRVLAAVERSAASRASWTDV
ncbi:Gfo/Idh/MocA family protein [Actinomyces ruminis]|uniref:Gfo/Idh/MocA family oxidoreductase n=1 Tax=Actinomyces ruminis TaxID=1937003 RepID=A0ABX4M8A6_9ACTO|nr:Gfo/Idh/MocA family oxidoreductase [Actinomyces ruminis]PHP51328.1 gfo/Idh/MocA family oxidoreductase [Actinomyces ruminis]